MAERTVVRTKTQKKDDSRARYKWLKVVFLEIDECKVKIENLEKELRDLKETENYLSDEIKSIKEGEKNGHDGTKKEN